MGANSGYWATSSAREGVGGGAGVCVGVEVGRGVEVSFGGEQYAPWWITSPEDAAFQKASQALSQAYGKPCTYMGEGGSIPFVGPFSA